MGVPGIWCGGTRHLVELSSYHPRTTLVTPAGKPYKSIAAGRVTRVKTTVTVKPGVDLGKATGAMLVCL